MSSTCVHCSKAYHKRNGNQRFCSTRCRFFHKVDKRQSYGPDGTCHRWTAAVNANGYGKFMMTGGVRRAHIVAYELSKGCVPIGKVVRHTCDMPACVNPAHLLVGTVLENVQDMTRRGRRASFEGEKHGRAKLDESAIRAIRRMRQSGATQQAVAAHFKVSRSLISLIDRKQAWPHVTDDC